MLQGHKANWEENFYFYLITLKIAISIWYNGIMIVVLEGLYFLKTFIEIFKVERCSIWNLLQNNPVGLSG